MDFVVLSRLRGRMDEDTAELINMLCTRVVMIMEDVSDLALTIGGSDSAERTKRLQRLGHAVDQMSLLIRAAVALHT